MLLVPILVSTGTKLRFT